MFRIMAVALAAMATFDLLYLNGKHFARRREYVVPVVRRFLMIDRGPALFAVGVIIAASSLWACTTEQAPETAWVRTDGRRIADDPSLLQQGKSDMAACDANLDDVQPTDSTKGCMARKGYTLVQKDQAEEVRSAYAAAARSGAAQGEQH
jgi:hypothetical protein